MQGIAILASIIAAFLLIMLILAVRGGNRWRVLYEAARESTEQTRRFFTEERSRFQLQLRTLREDNARLRAEVESLRPKAHVPERSEAERRGPPSSIVRAGPPTPRADSRLVRDSGSRALRDDGDDLALDMARFQATQMAVAATPAPSAAPSYSPPACTAPSGGSTSSSSSDSGSSSTSCD